ncbi:ribulose bisphosphate carboxylase small subunit, chloroplastic-like [Malus domestica]|uniref:ribulose bisphosphate carboxylase small subunit, chloroplastic-like n=1 Tax=Malus domestica TaxID=3750 RepID=UPI003975327E
MSAAIFNAPVGASGYAGLKANPWKVFPVNDSIGWAKKTVSNGSRTLCMKVRESNKLYPKYPRFSSSVCGILQVGYVYRENSQMPGYYDGRYWTLWKLPMFGCSDPSLVLNEIQQCKTEYPNAYIRCVAFDNVNQGQCMAFIIQKPTATAAAATTTADA